MLMTPTKADITFVRGNTYAAKFTFTGRDLTGATLIWRAVRDGTEVLRRASGGSGITIPTPANGEAFLALTTAQTRAFSVGAMTDYEFELRLAGEEITVFYGKVNAILGFNDDA
jgi:hypothetical protein